MYVPAAYVFFVLSLQISNIPSFYTSWLHYSHVNMTLAPPIFDELFLPRVLLKCNWFKVSVKCLIWSLNISVVRPFQQLLPCHSLPLQKQNSTICLKENKSFQHKNRQRFRRSLWMNFAGDFQNQILSVPRQSIR